MKYFFLGFFALLFFGLAYAFSSLIGFIVLGSIIWLLSKIDPATFKWKTKKADV